jgi:hypothetical protein
VYKRSVTFCTHPDADKVYDMVAGAIRDSPDFYIIREDETARQIEIKFAKDEDRNSLFRLHVINASSGSRIEFSFTLEKDVDWIENQRSIAIHRLVESLSDNLPKKG